MKYQCNFCGRIYNEKEYAAICHPNISELDDLSDNAEAAQQSVEPTLDDLTREDRLSLVPDHWARLARG